MKNCSKSKYILLFKVYNILAKPESAGGAGIPCVYALFPQEMATYLKMFSIIKENWEIVASYLQLFLTLKGLYLKQCIMCIQARDRAAAGFILTLQFGRILVRRGFKVFFFTRIQVTRKCSKTCSVDWPTFLVDKVQTFTRTTLKNKLRRHWKKMRNGQLLWKKFKHLLYTSGKPGLSIEEAILHCLLQIYGINMKLYCRVVHRPTKCLRAITGRLTV